MSKRQFDLLVVGGGSGGVAAARRAAEYGARAAVCEEDRYGGTCLHRGCVPKKLMVYAAEYADLFQDCLGYGWSVTDARFDWPRLIAAKDRELDRLNEFYNRMLENSGVDRVPGKARFLDAHTVEVDGQRYAGDKLLIAVGGRPWVPPVEGRELAITSNEIFHLEQLPRRIVIVGSGYIGVEFAGILKRLGSEVTMVFRSAKVLPRFDEEIRSALQADMEVRGIRFRTEGRVQRIEQTGKELTAHLQDGTGLVCDQLLIATGRVPNTEGLGLEDIGVKLGQKGAVEVDDQLRTSVENIYALGDCIDRIQLTPVAIAEGRALAESLYNDNPSQVDYAHVATAVFSTPPVGVVGLTEEQARDRVDEVDVYRSSFRPMKFTLAGRESKVLMKLIVDRATDRVLGCHLLGEGSSEMIQLVAVALQCGATKAQFDKTVAVHPTSAEELVLMRSPV